MNIIYSDHATLRMKQRGITSLEIEQVLEFPVYIKKSFEGRKIAFGIVRNCNIKVSFKEEESYIKIITIM
ncbi:MAG: DUF4258 domain-containing protein [Candidatus Nanoarchaeia archaeon]|nr:DUF4258 domain-containing protein [Candidatus Nanoarchaeia archaeon]